MTGTRLAFSTLGCPGLPLDQVADLAKRHGCGAVELRCFDGEPVAPPGPESDVAGSRRAVQRLREAGVEALSLASYVHVAERDSDPVTATLRHVELAAAVGAPYVRVFGHRAGDPTHWPEAVRTLRRVAEHLNDSAVRVVLETHDSFRTGAHVARILTEVGSPHVGALWDVVNPWRSGEQPDETLDHLRPWLAYVQLKDVASTDDLAPVLPGHGSVPLHGVLAALARHHYAGWLSLEWERAWFPQIPDLDAALPAFAAAVASDRP
jgi:sugar phosphate isomerase/epimerase